MSTFGPRLSRRDFNSLMAGAGAVALASCGARAPNLPRNIKERFAGTGVEVTVPGDSSYNELRRVFDERADKHPLAILECSNVAQVQAALAFARQYRTPIAVRSGGHGFTGRSTIDQGLLIDLARMDSIELDSARGVVTVGPGVRTAALLGATMPKGVVPVTTTSPHIGVVGAALFSGQGYLSPQHGNMCDTVQSFDLVTAEGALRRVDALHDPDLFWAVRGAGDNFGIVTSMTLKVFPLPQKTTVCSYVYGIAEAESVMRKYRDHRWSSPPALLFGSLFIDPQSGQPLLSYLFPLTGSDEQTKADVQQFDGYGKPRVRTVREMSWLDLHSQLPVPNGGRGFIAQRELHGLDDQTITLLVEEARRLATDPDRASGLEGMPGNTILFFPNAGAMERTAQPPNAYGLRGGYDVEVYSVWADPAKDQAFEAWPKRVVKRLVDAGKAKKPSVLANSAVDEKLTRDCYGADYDRLARLKGRVDPEGVFGSTALIRPTVA